MPMIRGTTAQFKFKLPYPKDELEWITIMFWQPNNPNLQPIYKNKTCCSSTDNPNEICVSLSADETALFSDKYKAKVQLRARLLLGEPFGCRERMITVYPMNDSILGNSDPTIAITPTEQGWFILDSGDINDATAERIVLDAHSIASATESDS
jgi:hypothetical protein